MTALEIKGGARTGRVRTPHAAQAGTHTHTAKNYSAVEYTIYIYNLFSLDPGIHIYLCT